MDYRQIKNKKHYIYEHISEFYNAHPDKTPVKDWRQAKEGDWVWSDDGNIVQLLKVVDKIKHPNRYTFSGRNPKSVKEREGVTNKEKIFATNVAVGMGPVKAYMDAFSSDDELQARRKATILLKQERVMQEVEKSVLDIAKGMGLDHEYVLNKLKCLADSSSDDGIVLQSTKELAKIIGTSGTTIKQKEMGIIGMFQGFTPEQLEKAERPQLKEVKGESDDVS